MKKMQLVAMTGEAALLVLSLVMVHELFSDGKVVFGSIMLLEKLLNKLPGSRSEGSESTEHALHMASHEGHK